MFPNYVQQIRSTHTIRVVSIVMPCDFRVWCGLDLKRLASTSCFRVGLVMIDFGDRFWRKTLEISMNSLFFVRCFFQGIGVLLIFSNRNKQIGLKLRIRISDSCGVLCIVVQ